MDEHTPELAVASINMLHCDPEAILGKRRKFSGTAALVDDLLPYYHHAVKIMGNGNGGTAVQKYALPPQGDFSHFPETKAKEVRQHLAGLQFSADGFETRGETRRAEEIRDVADNLFGMLKIIQQIGHHEAVSAGKPQPRGNGRAGS